MVFKNNSFSPILLIAIISIFIIAGVIFYFDYHKYDNHIVLNTELDLTTKVDQMKIDHGYAILNDSIIIPSGSALKNKDQVIKNNSNLFIELDNPFKLIKKSGSQEFIVIKNYDTLIFNIAE